MVSFCILVLGCIVISIVDARTCRIPDGLLAVFFCALTAAGIGETPAALWDRLLPARLPPALICFTVLYLPCRFCGGLGFGDVKYAALLGYALGPERYCVFLAAAALSGLLIYITGTFFLNWDRETKLPFAPFLSFGALAAAALGIPGP
ncbi:MAG: A24 family peptidase [Treponema sp.]|jgi:prepilin signal peptidase PulO-like enzyme (type II secretory pathway)|nr:A24 family peptidase [Treponema sp.]